MNSGFERGIEDIVGSVSSAAKKSIAGTVKATGQQIAGSQSGSGNPGGAEMSAFETNSSVGKTSFAPTFPMQAQQQTVEEQQHLAKVRQELQSRHMTTYFNPTFNQKPAQIAQEREQKYQQSQAHEEQKKEQTEFMQEEKRKEYGQIALDKKAKGEIGKVGSG